MTHRFMSDKSVVPAVVPTAGAVAAITAAVVDGTGWDEANFVLVTGAANTAATLDAKVQESATSGGSYADHGNATDITQLLAASGASKVVVISLKINSAKPFMKIVGTVGTETFANAGVCILSKGSRQNPMSTTARATAGCKEVVEVV